MDTSLLDHVMKKDECSLGNQEVFKVKEECDDVLEEEEVAFNFLIDDANSIWQEDPLRIDNIKNEVTEDEEMLPGELSPLPPPGIRVTICGEDKLKEEELVVKEEVNCEDNFAEENTIDDIFGNDDCNKTREECSLFEEKSGDGCRDVFYRSQNGIHSLVVDPSNNILQDNSTETITEISVESIINKSGNCDYSGNINSGDINIGNSSNIVKKYVEMVKEEVVVKESGIAEEVEKFKCKFWCKTFNCAFELDSHTDMHAKRKALSCCVCEKSFNYSSELKRHMRLHTGEKPFSCTFCEKSFTQFSTLKTHMHLHTRDQPFSCNYCVKSFNCSSDLKRHMRLHTGEKPFSCTVCGKSFTQFSSLKTHMHLHTGDKPFSCNVCEKSFVKSSHLKTHMHSHTGEKPFSCTVCVKSFINNSDLNKHMRVHTREKPFSCNICEKSFTQSSHLKTHMVLHAS